MSDDLQQRLRAAYDDLPLPSEDETAAARRAVLALTPARPWRPRRVLAIAFAGIALAAAAFGGGWAVASSADAPAEPEPDAPLNAGPGFLPAPGWEVAATGELLDLRAPLAVAANVSLSPEDRLLQGPPAATARRLGPNGILFRASFQPAGTVRAKQRLLPLQLRDAERVGPVEGLPRVGSTRRLVARVGRYDVDVLVLFGAARPSPGVLAGATEQLARLVVPACPAALPLTGADLASAEAFALAWLRTHHQGDTRDLAGARATASLGAEMPRGGAARTACGDEVFRRTVEVDVVLPRLERVSASLSQHSYFVSRTPDGWTVWQRIH